MVKKKQPEKSANKDAHLLFLYQEFFKELHLEPALKENTVDLLILPLLAMCQWGTDPVKIKDFFFTHIRIGFNRSYQKIDEIAIFAKIMEIHFSEL